MYKYAILKRSNGVNYVLRLPYLIKRTADASWEWWWPLWMSKVIRGQIWSTMYYGYHIWSKEPLMQAKNDDDLHRASEVKCGKLCAMATIFGQMNRRCKLRIMMTFMEVNSQQRSNIVNYATWLPNLVRRTADASLGWWRPSWRSKGQQRSNIVNNDLCKPAWSEELLIQV